MSNTFTLSHENFVKVSGFLNIGYKDYLAARTLLANGLLYRGIIVSATSIEKLLKVFIILNGSAKKTHNVEKLFNEAIKYDNNLRKALNSDFIKLLSKAYNMRYLDNDVFNNNSINFRVTVAQYKILAELDITAITLLNSWKMQHEGKELESEYHTNLKELYPLLYDRNFILNKTNKKEFIEQEQLIYEIFNQENGILELNYRSNDVTDDSIFN